MKQTRLRRWLAQPLGFFVMAALLLAACNVPTPTPPPGLSADWYVDPAGDDGNSCQTLADACATVGAAIGKAASGDSIAIAAGVYNEQLTVDKPLTLQGAGAGTTEIEAGRSGRALLVERSAVLVVMDLSLRAGSAQLGGCLRNDGGDLTLHQVTIENCEAEEGAGIHNTGALYIEDSTVRNNVAATRGGGLYTKSDPAVEIQRTTFEANEAPVVGDRSDGGAAVFAVSEVIAVDSSFDSNQGDAAIRLLDGSLDLSSSTLSDNQNHGLATNVDPGSGRGPVQVQISDSTFSGNGGVGLQVTNTQLTLTDSVLELNGAGGINIANETAQLTNVVVEENGKSVVSGVAGGIWARDVDLSIEEGEIRANVSPGTGGGIYFEDKQGNGNLMLSGTLLENNQAQQGGGLYVASGTADIVLASFIGNQAEEGGGIYAARDTQLTTAQRVDLSSVLVQGNQATSGNGGGVQNWTVFQADATTFAGNSASDQGGAIYNGVRTQGAPGDQPSIFLLNATISGNQAQSGGGLANHGVMRLNYVTIAENQATGGGGGLASSFNPPAGSDVRNTILAGNSSGVAGEENCSGPAGGFQGGNLEDLDTCSLSNANDKPNTDPLLGPLQNNGGVSTSLTHLPAGNSPVIDAAIGGDCPPIDQRGVNRPQAAACDIGAVEVEAPSATATPAVSCKAALAFEDAEYANISYRPSSDGVLVVLDVPGAMEQEQYDALVNTRPFTCTRDADFPQRLFCIGPRLTAGAPAEMTVLGEGCTQPAYETTFSVPLDLYPAPTPTPTNTPPPIEVEISPTPG